MASSLPLGLNATPETPAWVGGQDAILLLPGQQGCHGGIGLGGGEDPPGGDGEPPRGHVIGGVNAEAFGGELAGQGDGMLPGDIGGVADGDPGGGEGGQGEGEEARDHCLPTARLAAVGAVAGVQEILFGLAERRVAGGVGADPGSGVGGGLEQAAGVEVGRVAGVAGPLGGGGVQPGADDPVGAGVGEPGVAQQRPGGQQRLVADFHGAGGEGEQPFGGEGLQHGLDILGLGRALAVLQFRPGGAVGAVHAVAAGGGQPQEHLPGRGLLGRSQGVVGALRAVGDRTFDAAGAFIVGEGERPARSGTARPGPGRATATAAPPRRRSRAGRCAPRPAAGRSGRRRPWSRLSWLVR